MGLLIGTVLSKFGFIDMDFQQGDAFRNWTGSALLVSILAQWALSIGRLVYQKQGAQWDDWVEVHQALAWAVPLLALVHSLQLGYGLLGFLPLALFASLLVLLLLPIINTSAVRSSLYRPLYQKFF